jgi:hypothetical protein
VPFPPHLAFSFLARPSELNEAGSSSGKATQRLSALMIQMIHSTAVFFYFLWWCFALA